MSATTVTTSTRPAAGIQFLLTVLVIARATLLETVRRKLVIALAAVTLVAVGLSAWLFNHVSTIDIPYLPSVLVPSYRDFVTSQMLLFTAFAFSCVLGLTAAFIAAPAIGAEIESGTALAIVARPVSRSAIVLGKWTGLAGLLVLYTAVAGFAELQIVNWSTGYQPSDPVAVVVYLAAVGVVVMSLGLLLSTRMGTMASGIIVIVLFFGNWMLGIAGSVGITLDTTGAAGGGALVTAGNIARLVFPSDGLWRGALYGTESNSVLGPSNIFGGAAAVNPFAANTAPEGRYVFWCVGWVAAILILTILSFRRREV